MQCAVQQPLGCLLEAKQNGGIRSQWKPSRWGRMTSHRNRQQNPVGGGCMQVVPDLKELHAGVGGSRVLTAQYTSSWMPHCAGTCFTCPVPVESKPLSIGPRTGVRQPRHRLAGLMALPRQSGKPCQGWPGSFKLALAVCISFTLLHWRRPQHALALNLGSPAVS